MSNLGSDSLTTSMDWPLVDLANAAFLACALMASVFFLNSQKHKFGSNHGIFVYLKFIYANFLKPHDKSGEGQQHALESFYKTQVCIRVDFFPSSTKAADI